MADPRNELADIIAPTAPMAATATGNGSFFWWGAAAAIALATCALLAWLWHRQRPARALHAIVAAAARRQGTAPALAARLDAWARRHFQLARLDPRRAPTGADPVAWSRWVETLEQLRFGPQSTDGFAVLTQLGERARAWRRHA